MNRSFLGFLFLLPFTISSASADTMVPQYDSDHLQVWGGAGLLKGDATYRIGGHVTGSLLGNGDVPFPISELKWPLDSAIVGVGTRISFFHHLELQGQVMKIASPESAKMADSDWLYSISIPEIYLPDYRSIYSLSDSSVQGYKNQGSVRYVWKDEEESSMEGKTVQYGLGAGLLYEHFSWEARNTDQWYPNSPQTPHDILPGLNGTYWQTMSIPYIEAVGQYATSQINVTGSLGFSPRALVTNEDDHLLRQFRSTGHAEGTAYLASATVRYDFLEILFSFDPVRSSLPPSQRQVRPV